MKKIIFFILSLALLSACKQKISEYNVGKGSANFSKYIAIGNSLMAGYADGALYQTGQKYSIPNLIAGQLQLAGAQQFVQPIVPSEYGVGFQNYFEPKFILGYVTDCQNETTLAPVYSTGTLAPLAPVGYKVDNLAVPGAKSFHILAKGYGSLANLLIGKANPYYYRFASSDTSSVLTDALSKNATFFTMWLGDNDVLSYAMKMTANDSITSPGFFQACLGGILQGLTANGAKGVISTIPDITAIPFFTVVPYNGLNLITDSLANLVNFAMAMYQIPGTCKKGNNPFLIRDDTCKNPYHVRQMLPGEYVLISVPTDSLKCKGMGIFDIVAHTPYPIPSNFVLTLGEVQQIEAAISAYNLIIQGLASTFSLGLVDMNARLKELQSGITWDGIKFNTQFVTGGVFSLDGVHLNPRGNAIAANYFIDAINTKYGSTIPHVDVTSCPGILFP